MIDVMLQDLLNPTSLVASVSYGVIFLGIATVTAVALRKAARNHESHLSDDTGIMFASAFAQLMILLVAFILYAHLVPELRAMGTALLAGVSVVLAVLGPAAQNTLGIPLPGCHSRSMDPFELATTHTLGTPKGPTNAEAEQISLGFTVLRDSGEMKSLFHTA